MTETDTNVRVNDEYYNKLVQASLSYGDSMKLILTNGLKRLLMNVDDETIDELEAFKVRMKKPAKNIAKVDITPEDNTRIEQLRKAYEKTKNAKLFRQDIFNKAAEMGLEKYNEI